MILEKQSLSAQDQRILRALDRAAGDLRQGEAVFVFDGSSGVAPGPDGPSAEYPEPADLQPRYATPILLLWFSSRDQRPVNCC